MEIGATACIPLKLSFLLPCICESRVKVKWPLILNEYTVFSEVAILYSIPDAWLSFLPIDGAFADSLQAVGTNLTKEVPPWELVLC